MLPAPLPLGDVPPPQRLKRDLLVPLVALASAGAWPAAIVVRLNGLFLAVTLGVVAAAVALRGRRDLVLLPAVTGIALLLLTFPALSFPPTPLLVALGLGLGMSGFRAPWLARGQLGGAVAGWIAAFVAASVLALVLWWGLVRPNVSDLPRLPSGFHPVVLIAGVVAWSACNAAAEELYFRGAMQHELVRCFGRSGIALQALAFGIMHLHGFPRGWSGVVLASIYGGMMGALRWRARGLLAPWIAHLFADLAIVAIRATALG